MLVVPLSTLDLQLLDHRTQGRVLGFVTSSPCTALTFPLHHAEQFVPRAVCEDDSHHPSGGCQG